MIYRMIRDRHGNLDLNWVAYSLLALSFLMLLATHRAYSQEPPVAVDDPPVALDAGSPVTAGPGWYQIGEFTPPAVKRVKEAGYWWDRLPDGRLHWCTECNGPYPAAGVLGIIVVDWNGAKPAAPAVAPPPPFGQRPATTPGISVPPAAVHSTSFGAPARHPAPTHTGAFTTAPFGTTNSPTSG